MPVNIEGFCDQKKNVNHQFFHPLCEITMYKILVKTIRNITKKNTVPKVRHGGGSLMFFLCLKWGFVSCR